DAQYGLSMILVADSHADARIVGKGAAPVAPFVRPTHVRAVADGDADELLAACHHRLPARQNRFHGATKGLAHRELEAAVALLARHAPPDMLLIGDRHRLCPPTADAAFLAHASDDLLVGQMAGADLLQESQPVARISWFPLPLRRCRLPVSYDAPF